MNELKPYLPRLLFTFFVLGLTLNSVRELAIFISIVDFGLGRLNYGFSFTISLIFFGASIWVGFGLVSQVASSLGYKGSKEKGFVITGDGNVIHLSGSEEEKRQDANFKGNLILQAYDSDRPLLALQQGRARILDHISGLRNSSIFNLFIGIAIAAIGIATIGTIFFEIEKYANSQNGFDAANFLLLVIAPRLSIALIVQLFSFFFLLMYRSNVNDVRYFQNEITNIDLIAAGVSLVKKDGDPNAKSTINSLIKTERNKVISKNQKVIGLASDDDVLKKLAAIDNKISHLSKGKSIKSEDKA